MKEQSHKDEMASVLKADFDRLRARGVATTLAPTQLVEELEPAAFAPDLESEETTENVLRPEQQAGEETLVESDGGWLRRLLGSS